MLTQLRRWQRDAFAVYQQKLAEGERSALWEATPGAGKTSAALEVIIDQLKFGRSQHALVVVPTSHLRIQWARAALKRGLHLDSAFGARNSRLGKEFQGAVVTYQQFGNRLTLFRSLASHSVVILDEVHHTGDGLSWGNAVQKALVDARFILGLSGTAFRSDNNPIPYVKYDPSKVSVPDYAYTYASAVHDKVCRPIAVLTYGGSVGWSECDKVFSASFDDRLDSVYTAKRLRTALDPESGWIQPMLKDAHKMLQGIRSEQPNAGGLLVCADQEHARKLAIVLTEITREKPTVVLSDDSTASRKIKTFSDSSTQWLVACNMVSEGVDIPRLRVGVYATTIKTKMYFRQFVGRIVRRQSNVAGLQVAYLYIPADPSLHYLAEEIESESRHILKTAGDSFFDDQERRAKSEATQVNLMVALNSINSGVSSVIVQGSQLDLFGNDLMGGEINRELVDREVAQHLEERLTRSEIKTGLASEIKNLVGLVHRKTGRSHSDIHIQLNKAQGVRSQTYCSETQLVERKLLLETMLQRGKPFASRGSANISPAR
jgi:superfamily II DNA or RNA helicase